MTDAFKHPSDETLQRYACGGLRPGLALVMRVHLGGCPSCRAALRRFEAVGGALLDDLPPARVSPALLEKIFARIDSAARPGGASRARCHRRRFRPACGHGRLQDRPLALRPSEIALGAGGGSRRGKGSRHPAENRRGFRRPRPWSWRSGADAGSGGQLYRRPGAISAGRPDRGG